MSNEVTWPLLQNVIRGNKLNNTFGMVRHDSNGKLKPHQGWDFAAPVGTVVYSIADGVVEYTKTSGALGKRICIKFQFEGKDFFALYAHLRSIYKHTGDKVSMNDEIGTTGKTGNASNLPASEDHLHFEIRTKKYSGLGLKDRESPLKIFKKCPLHTPITG